MNSILPLSRIRRFVDDKALVFIALLFILFCLFFTLGYSISFMNFS